jgi:two-component system nitrate/nitrite response regulator NarL
VVVADDHESYRKGLVRAIGADPRLRLVGQAGDGDEALALIGSLEPDLALLDVRMPGIDGFEVCRRVEGRPVRVVMLSAFVSEALVARAREVGAAAYLSKDATRGEICDTLVKAASEGLPDAG